MITPSPGICEFSRRTRRTIFTHTWMYLWDIGEDHSIALFPGPSQISVTCSMAKHSYTTDVRNVPAGMYQPLRTALSTVTNYIQPVQTNYNKLAEQSRASLVPRLLTPFRADKNYLPSVQEVHILPRIQWPWVDKDMLVAIASLICYRICLLIKSHPN